MGNISGLKAGFSSTYIDPHNLARQTAMQLRKFMAIYTARQSDYIAPYTSLVTSSMMGKSRLMKEMAAYIPVVYICARGSGLAGYPERTPEIIAWLESGVKGRFAPYIVQSDIYYILSTLKYCSFLLATFDRLSTLLRTEDAIQKFEIREQARYQRYTWMWNYFAEPDDGALLEEFWRNVVESAEEMMIPYKNPEQAITYLQKGFRSRVRETFSKLSQSFKAVGYRDEKTILLFCDEARRFCDISAADGSPIYEEYDAFRNNEKISSSSSDVLQLNVPFSSFRAFRRALRFTHSRGSNFGAFAVFTDTSSRLTNFQPLAGEDRSMRILKLELFPLGNHQFDPIYVFTSFDAWSRVLDKCSSVQDVASPERLVNFGRAGWHTLYSGRNAVGEQVGTNDDDIDVAQAKLLCYGSESKFHYPWTADLNRAILLKLFAVLAPRLAITAGPYSLEASEIVASHMAVLVRTDGDRHFLRTAYPSEPILAEASARLTAENGWGRPLRALNHYVQTGIVDAGFRGELLTKIICLIANDTYQHSIPHDPSTQWQYTRPIRVSDFLNSLIATDGIAGKASNSEPESKFVDYLMKCSAIELGDLRAFLNGYVFFTHFIKVECTASIQLLARAWNRGAAITCKAYNPRFDHIIPVMFHDANIDRFGPLYGPWSEEQITEARRSMSYILIDSKNYSERKNWSSHVGNVSPQDGFTTNLIGSLPVQNVYLSMVQDFGMREDEEPAVIVGHTFPGASDVMTLRPREPKKQIRIILKGLDDQTYECLKDRPEEDRPSLDVTTSIISQDSDREDTRRYLSELRDARSGYLDFEPGTEWEVRQGVADSLPLIFGCEDQIDDHWLEEQAKHDNKMQLD